MRPVIGVRPVLLLPLSIPLITEPNLQLNPHHGLILREILSEYWNKVKHYNKYTWAVSVCMMMPVPCVSLQRNFILQSLGFIPQIIPKVHATTNFNPYAVSEDYINSMKFILVLPSYTVFTESVLSVLYHNMILVALEFGPLLHIFLTVQKLCSTSILLAIKLKF